MKINTFTCTFLLCVCVNFILILILFWNYLNKTYFVIKKTIGSQFYFLNSISLHIFSLQFKVKGFYTTSFITTSVKLNKAVQKIIYERAIHVYLTSYITWYLKTISCYICWLIGNWFIDYWLINDRLIYWLIN